MITLHENVAGGYFVWLRLPDGLSGDHVAFRASEKENLVVATGSMFEVSGDAEKEGTHFENYLRLCFAWEDEANLERGIERLSRVITELKAIPLEGHETI
jgi:DNA-binding transcriptional MocR family regulator